MNEETRERRKRNLEQITVRNWKRTKKKRTNRREELENDEDTWGNLDTRERRDHELTREYLNESPFEIATRPKRLQRNEEIWEQNAGTNEATADPEDLRPSGWCVMTAIVFVVVTRTEYLVWERRPTHFGNCRCTRLTVSLWRFSLISQRRWTWL